eukprot:1159648-Pelagomonas_calceolata.AAC.5
MQPITIDGETRDRTPKPLISTGAGPVTRPGPPQDDPGSPTSETSEFFMDRMSTAGFSARGGWGRCGPPGLCCVCVCVCVCVCERERFTYTLQVRFSLCTLHLLKSASLGANAGCTAPFRAVAQHRLIDTHKLQTVLCEFNAWHLCSESNAGSGSSTPKTQDTGDLIDAAEASKRERAKAMAAATAAAGAIVQAEEEEAQVGSEIVVAVGGEIAGAVFMQCHCQCHCCCGGGRDRWCQRRSKEGRGTGESHCQCHCWCGGGETSLVQMSCSVIATAGAVGEEIAGASIQAGAEEAQVEELGCSAVCVQAEKMRATVVGALGRRSERHVGGSMRQGARSHGAKPFYLCTTSGTRTYKHCSARMSSRHTSSDILKQGSQTVRLGHGRREG